jgi:hypothetical protein
MSFDKPIRRIAIVGTGVIGARWGPELQQKIVAGVLQETAGRSIDELDHYRDEVVLGLLSLRAKADSSTVS